MRARAHTHPSPFRRAAAPREQLKAENDEYSDAPFAPTLHTERADASRRAQSKLRIVSDPDTYLDRLKQEARARQEALSADARAREQREEDELTFTPQTTECPAYVKRIARSIALTKAARNTSGASTVTDQAKPEWR